MATKPKKKPAPKPHPKGKGIPKEWAEAAKAKPVPAPTPPRIPPKVEAVLAVVPRRTSRGSTDGEIQRGETHYLTGVLGQELAKSNARVKELLEEQGIKVRPLSLNLCPPQFMAFMTDVAARQVAEKLARIGEALAGAGKQVPRMPTKAEIAAVTPPKPKMTDETKAMLRQKAKESKAAKPHDSGDPVARMLRDAHELDDVYKVAAKYLGVKEKELREKYGHLNPGQQRMNCGNRMRGKWRKENK